MSTTLGSQRVRLLVLGRHPESASALQALLEGRVGVECETEWMGSADSALRLVEQRRHDMYLIEREFDRAHGGAIVAAAVAAGCPPLVLLDGHRDHAIEEQVLLAGAAHVLWTEELSAPLLESAVRHALDLRDRIRLERQLHLVQRMETVGQLAGGIAHEFNNILTAIVGFGTLLADRVADDETSSAQIREILGGAERATALTRDLLAFSRRQVLRATRLDLPDVVIQLARMLRGVLGSHIELQVRCASGVPFIRADRAQLEQAITNLAMNAREAMPSGGGLTIEVDVVVLEQSYCDAHVSMRPGEYVRLTVSDTGAGIPKELQTRIFEPFFTTRDPARASGLGLSTVYGIVKQTGGNIWVYSEPGHGTTFKLYFPVDAASESECAAATPRTHERLGGSETILIVDDTEVVRRLAGDVLSRAGYRVLEAGGADHALQVAAGHQAAIDLLVTDVVMPGGNGVELVDRLCAERTGLRVLYISGYTALSIVRDGLLARDAAFLEKPFTPDELLRKVRAVLAG